MSALLHSIRALFGSSPIPATNNNNGAITRRRAKNYQSMMNNGGNDDDNDDDDVFSTYGDGTTLLRDDDDDDDNGTNANTQPPPVAAELADGGVVNNSNSTGILVMDDEAGLENQHNSSSGKAASSSSFTSTPLMEFFAHVASDDDHNNNESLVEATRSLANIAHCRRRSRPPLMSIKEWRAARKEFIVHFLTRRLFNLETSSCQADEEDIEVNDNDEGGRNSNRSNHQHCQHEYDDDDCSFSSGVLDEPFLEETVKHVDNTSGGDVAVELADPNDDDDDDNEEEEEEDNTQLQTQPLLMSEMAKQSSLSVSHRKRVGDSGIKRKLGFDGIDGASDNDDDDDDYDNTKSQLETQPQTSSPTQLQQQQLILQAQSSKATNANNHHPWQRGMRTSKKQRRDVKRGHIPWDGNFQAIPQIINNAPSNSTCSKLDDLDLSSNLLNLSLCRIIRVWDLRLTKRMDKLGWTRANSGGGGLSGGDARRGYGYSVAKSTSEEDPSSIIIPHEFYEDDGPLNIAYQRVFSIEVSQIDDDDDDDNINGMGLQGDNSASPSIANLAMAAFHDGGTQLKRIMARKRRHAVRRIRIFFYNKYADVVSNALHDLWGERKQQKVAGNNHNNQYVSLMSLANVPAKCILPWLIATPSDGSPHPHVQHYAMNPIGDEELGVISPFCICIGDESNLSLGDQGRLAFDDKKLEISLFFDQPPIINQCPTIDDVVGASDKSYFEFDDAAVTVTASSVNGGRYFKDVKRSRLSKTVGPCRRWKKNLNLSTMNDADENFPNAAAKNTESTNAGIAMGATAEAASGSRRARETESISATPLRDLHTLLLRNNMKKLDDSITVYGVVLGFTPPSLTSTQEWKMSIVLVDETLPLPDWAHEGQSNMRRVATNGSKPLEMHVPSVTLMLFMKDKSKLPVIQSAGDVICCEKVVLQSWSGEPQLCSKKHASKFVVIRWGKPSFPGRELQSSTSTSDWTVSCLCHESGAGQHVGLDLPRAQQLWRWGQQRLSDHPTMSPNCHLSIAGVGDHNENAEVCEPGDLTAAVTAIIPMPEHLRRRDTPRGFIRLWDGTGPSRSDQLPLDATEIVGVHPHDPPEQVLLEIEKIITNFFTPDSLIDAPLTLCGRVVNAIVWEEDLWNLISKDHILRIGTFARLRNVNNTKMQRGSSNGLSIHARSSLTPLPSNAFEIKELLRRHDSRVKKGDAPNPSSAILPSRSRRGVIGDLRTIDECYNTPPATFTIQFEVTHILPAFIPTSSDALKIFCMKQKDGSSKLQFSLHVRDASSETDILCLGKVAEDILGITPLDVVERSDRCEGAICKLKCIVSPGSRCRGTIRSCVKNGNTYFFLKSMTCITN